MDRRKFFGFAVVALATGVVSVLGGCSKTESIPKLGNQEKLWIMTSASEKVNEPIDLAYVKNTPAAYRDASFGKEDPNFKPKTGRLKLKQIRRRRINATHEAVCRFGGAPVSDSDVDTERRVPRVAPG